MSNGSILSNSFHLCYPPAGNCFLHLQKKKLYYEKRHFSFDTPNFKGFSCVNFLRNQKPHWGSQGSNWAKHVQGRAIKQSPDCSERPERIHRRTEVPECSFEVREHPPQKSCEAGGLLL